MEYVIELISGVQELIVVNEFSVKGILQYHEQDNDLAPGIDVMFTHHDNDVAVAEVTFSDGSVCHYIGRGDQFTGPLSTQ